MTSTRTKAAQFVYFVGGKLAKIPTRQSVFRMANEEKWLSNETDTIVWEKVGKSWLPCRLSTKFLSWSMSIDPVHWDHWALEHKGCGASLCMDCKGYAGCGDQN